MTTTHNKVAFDKSYTNPEKLVQLLRTRGLRIEDPVKAAHYLANIGYYRLSAYMYPLLAKPKENHKYKKGSSFRQIIMLYRFDKKLRLLLFNEIEKIEVAIRSIIVSKCCEATSNPFWMTDSSNFIDSVKFQRTIQLIETELQHSREEFIIHFKNSYTNPYPPAWMLGEILPFGILTNIFSNIKDKKIKKRVAQYFGLQAIPFQSWLTIVTLTRNACCHHARVWNKQNTIRPMMPNKINLPWISLPTDNLRIYFDLCIIKYFLNVISPGNDMLNKLQSLLAAYPEVDTAALGFPLSWESEPLWNE
uniref:Abi family protein n=2 Tax=unclassified Prevotella TaxID=2638335 RepID=A0AB33IUN4_9BACT